MRLRLGQNWNGPAVLGVVRVFINPELANPHVRTPHVGRLNATALRALGVRALLLDKDNTVTAPYAEREHARVAPGLAALRREFPGAVAILSNSAGGPDDEGHRDADTFEASLGLPVIRHARKKPACLEEVLSHFRSTPAGRDIEPSEICVVGDRLLTDVVFGNLHGMLTVHVGVLTLDNDNRAAALVRRVEDRFVTPLLKGGRPPPHPLLAAAGVRELAEATELLSARADCPEQPPGAEGPTAASQARGPVGRKP